MANGWKRRSICLGEGMAYRRNAPRRDAASDSGERQDSGFAVQVLSGSFRCFRQEAAGCR